MPSMLPPGVPAAPKIHIPKLGMPKLASVHVQKMNGGIKIQHHMTHGPKPVPFVFQDPQKALTHLKRIQDNQWRMPDKNYAGAVNKTLDLSE